MTNQTNEYLVTYRNKLFSGHRVVEARSELEAKEIMTAQGYRVIKVEIAVEDDYYA